MKKSKLTSFLYLFLFISLVGSIPGWVYLGYSIKYQNELNDQNNKYKISQFPHK